MKNIITLAIAASLTCGAYAQTIPNANFENWTSHGSYSTPDRWGNLDSIGSLVSTYTCERGSPGPSGFGSYIKLTSKTAPIAGVIPGIAVSGKVTMIGTSDIEVDAGFPMNARPVALTGKWQYAPTGADQGHVIISMTKWNTALGKRDTITATDYALPGSVTSWTAFTIPINYDLSIFPDSCLIALSASDPSDPVPGSYLMVDELAFSSTPTGVAQENINASKISIFPNPAAGYIHVGYESSAAGSARISITDMNGRTIKEMDVKKISGANDFPINISRMAVGIYFVKIADESGISVKKLTVE